MTLYRLKWEGAPPDGGKAVRKNLPTAIVAANRVQMLEFLIAILKAVEAVAIPRRLTITAKTEKRRKR